MTPSTLPQSRSHKDAEVFTVVDDGPWNSAHGDVVPLVPRVNPRFVGIASDLGPAPPKAQPPPKWPIVRQNWIGTVHDMPYRSVAERRLVDEGSECPVSYDRSAKGGDLIDDHIGSLHFGS